MWNEKNPRLINILDNYNIIWTIHIADGEEFLFLTKEEGERDNEGEGERKCLRESARESQIEERCCLFPEPESDDVTLGSVCPSEEESETEVHRAEESKHESVPRSLLSLFYEIINCLFFKLL